MTAVVKPSRLLRGALVLVAAVNLVVAWVVLGAAPGAFRFPLVIGACCLGAAAGALAGLASVGNKRRIDISGPGQMRVTVQQKLAQSGRQTPPCQLMPSSAVWPNVLMLLVRGDDGKAVVVAVLADSVSAGEFRALAVAMRAIGGQEAPDQVFFEPHKIL